jgi:hypothetical protein
MLRRSLLSRKALTYASAGTVVVTGGGYYSTQLRPREVEARTALLRGSHASHHHLGFHPRVNRTSMSSKPLVRVMKTPSSTS